MRVSVEVRVGAEGEGEIEVCGSLFVLVWGHVIGLAHKVLLASTGINLATRLPCRSFSFRLFASRLLSCSYRVLILIFAVTSSFEAAGKGLRTNAVHLTMRHKVTNIYTSPRSTCS